MLTIGIKVGITTGKFKCIIDILHLLYNVSIISTNPVRDTINFIRMERNLMVHCSEWMIAIRPFFGPKWN
jgi:hypothetical protein